MTRQLRKLGILSDSTGNFSQYICRYDPGTGKFTAPEGGDGTYYFTTTLLVRNGEYAGFNLKVNDETMCSVWGEQDTNILLDLVSVGCSGVAEIVEGEVDR